MSFSRSAELTGERPLSRDRSPAARGTNRRTSSGPVVLEACRCCPRETASISHPCAASATSRQPTFRGTGARGHRARRPGPGPVTAARPTATQAGSGTPPGSPPGSSGVVSIGAGGSGSGAPGRSSDGSSGTGSFGSISRSGSGSGATMREVNQRVVAVARLRGSPRIPHPPGPPEGAPAGSADRGTMSIAGADRGRVRAPRPAPALAAPPGRRAGPGPFRRARSPLGS